MMTLKETEVGLSTRWRHSGELFRSVRNPRLYCTADDPQFDPEEFNIPVKLNFFQRLHFIFTTLPVERLSTE